LDSHVEVDGGLDEHAPELAAAENAEPDGRAELGS